MALIQHGLEEKQVGQFENLKMKELQVKGEFKSGGFR